MGKLDGKIAVLTGATSGLALASAKLFVAEGAKVYVTGRNQDNLDQAVRDLGGKATGIRADSSKLADMEKLFQSVKAQEGHINILFASAGAGGMNMPLGTITEEAYDSIFDLNVKGTIFTVQNALPLMQDGGSIILTGSIAGVKGFPGMSIYNSSKAAIRALGRTWAAELKDRNIRVNVISPGPIDTAVFAKAPAEMKAHFASMVPLGRLGRPEEIATTALFLASGDSSFITGTELFVDGGTAQI